MPISGEYVRLCSHSTIDISIPCARRQYWIPTKYSPLLCIPSRCVPSLCTPFCDWVIIKHRPRTKIGHTSQAAEYVSNIVCGRDSLLKSAIPPSQDPLYNFDTGQIDVVYCRLKSTLIGVKEIEGISLWRLGVSITSSCQNQKKRHLGGRLRAFCFSKHVL